MYPGFLYSNNTVYTVACNIIETRRNLLKVVQLLPGEKVAEGSSCIHWF